MQGLGGFFPGVGNSALSASMVRTLVLSGSRTSRTAGSFVQSLGGELGQRSRIR